MYGARAEIDRKKMNWDMERKPPSISLSSRSRRKEIEKILEQHAGDGSGMDEESSEESGLKASIEVSSDAKVGDTDADGSGNSSTSVTAGYGYQGSGVKNSDSKMIHTGSEQPLAINLSDAVVWAEILGEPVCRKHRRKRMGQQYGN
jgi:hypothetical protein